MSDTAIDTGPAARPAKTRLSTDARWIVSTGMTIAALLVALVGMMFQQNAMLMQQYGTINARIDDTNTSISARIDDTNASINARIDDGCGSFSSAAQRESIGFCTAARSELLDASKAG